jgi:hypothetical protein
VDERGRPFTDALFMVLLNASGEAVAFQLPSLPPPGKWHLRVDTSDGWLAPSGASPKTQPPGSAYTLSGPALAVLEWVPGA